MNITRIFGIATIFISYLQTSECNTTDIVFESPNWRVTYNALFSNLYKLVCICEQCPHLRQGLKIEMDINEQFYNYYSTLKNEYYFSMEEDERLIGLYYKRNYTNKKNSFSADVDLLFSNPLKFPRKVLQSFYVNEELVFGKPLEHYYRNQSVLITRNPYYWEFCAPFVNASNFIKIKDLGSETHILFQYRAWQEIRGLILSFTFLENLIEIKTPDFDISRGLHGEWILKDYGQYLEEDKKIEVALILVSDEAIMHPIPSSITLRNELLCGNLTANYPKKFSSGFPGFDHSFNNISAMLYVVIALNIMFGIYAIVATYLIK